MQTGMLIFVSCMAVVAAGCHSDTQKDQARTDTIEYDEYRPIAWTADGQHLLIKNRWWYTPADRTFTAIVQPPAALKNTEGYWNIIPSPDGDRLLWLEYKRMLISKFNETPQTVIPPIPTWLSLEAWQGEEDRFNTRFWLNNKDIFVQQSDRRSDRIACGIFNTGSQHWVRLPDKACIQSSTVAHVNYLHEQTYLVHSGAEGQASLEVMKIDVGRTQQTVLADLSLGPFDSAFPYQVQYRSREHIALLFDCELDLTKERVDCAESSKGSALYRWSSRGKKLRLLHLNLPNNMAMSHVHDRMAWLDKEAICVGNPGEKESPSCTPLPAIQR